MGALEHAGAGDEAVGTRVRALRDGPVGLDAAVDLARVGVGRWAERGCGRGAREGRGRGARAGEKAAARSCRGSAW